MEEIIKYISIVISVLSFVISMYNLRRSRIRQNYLEIDKQYADLLKIALSDPDLRDYRTIREKTRQNDKRFITKYNTYAYLVWNCMETFFDLSNKTTKLKDDTWLPVIREENKIHHVWFEKNPQLFKPKFQKYIDKLNDVQVRTGSVHELGKIYEFMTKQFPKNELKSKDQLISLINKGKYVLYIAENTLLSGNDRIIGYALVYIVDEYKSLWIDYLAVTPAYQDSGKGTFLFNKVLSDVKTGDYNAFMEVEIPENPEDEEETASRRLRFYKKQGAQILDIPYELPTPEGSLPMHLVFKRGRNTDILNRELLEAVISEVHDNIHADLKSMPDVKRNILKGLKDIKLS